MVASGTVPVEVAIPIVMGTNIATTMIVSMGHSTRPSGFRRALAGATVHDFFNCFTVLILLPLELFTGYLNKISHFAATALSGVGGMKFASPLSAFTKPTAKVIISLLGDSPILSLIVALLLFLALKMLVTLLEVLVLQRAERFIHEYIFRVGLTSMLFGIAVTVMVQSR